MIGPRALYRFTEILNSTHVSSKEKVKDLNSILDPLR